MPRGAPRLHIGPRVHVSPPLDTVLPALTKASPERRAWNTGELQVDKHSFCSVSGSRYLIPNAPPPTTLQPPPPPPPPGPTAHPPVCYFPLLKTTRTLPKIYRLSVCFLTISLFFCCSHGQISITDDRMPWKVRTQTTKTFLPWLIFSFLSGGTFVFSMHGQMAHMALACTSTLGFFNRDQRRRKPSSRSMIL